MLEIHRISEHLFLSVIAVVKAYFRIRKHLILLHSHDFILKRKTFQSLVVQYFDVVLFGVNNILINEVPFDDYILVWTKI